MDRRQFASMMLATASCPHWARADPNLAWYDEDWADTRRQRVLPVRVRWPAGDGPCALVFFSHGLGGSRTGGGLWGEAWRAAGLAVVHLQHPGSDAGVLRAGLAGLRRAASAEQYLARVQDARFAFDEIERRRERGGAWRRVRLDAVGFSGHSFGARLTQALAGEAVPGAPAGGSALLRDNRLRAFIAFSPGFGANEGSSDTQVGARFGAIERPFLCVTGTLDEAMVVGDATNATRRAAYHGLPAGHKAQLVLEGADHMTFAGQQLPPLRAALLKREPVAEARQPAHHALVAGVTTDWWLSALNGDAAARARLAAPSRLGAGDLWQQG